MTYQRIKQNLALIKIDCVKTFFGTRQCKINKGDNTLIGKLVLSCQRMVSHHAVTEYFELQIIFCKADSIIKGTNRIVEVQSSQLATEPFLRSERDSGVIFLCGLTGFK